MYHMQVMELAIGYCLALGVYDEDEEGRHIPEIENIDMQAWIMENMSNTELLSRWIYARQMIVNAKIFRKPKPEEGRDFHESETIFGGMYSE